MFLLAKYGEEATFYGWKLVTAGSSDLKANPTLASGDVKISKDGGALTNLSTLPTLSPASSTELQVTLSAAELQCRQAVVNFIDQTGTKEWQDNSYIVLTYGHPSAFLPFDFSSGSVSLTSASEDSVVAKVYNAQRADYQVPGSFGEGVASVQGDLTGAVAEVTALDEDERDAIAEAALDLTAGVESGITLRQALRLIVAAAAGKVDGAGTTTITIRNIADDKTRITATVDSLGNRAAITYDVT